MPELASVTDIRTRHSWLKEPRKDDPNRSIYTCRRSGCGLKRRSEFDGQERIQLWLWPEGVTGGGKNYPPCRGGGIVPVECGGEPASVPPSPAANEGAVPVTPAAVTSPPPPEVADLPACTRCVPPCGRTGHPTLGGPTCVEGAEVVAKKRAAHLVELRSATSGMGVPTWRGGAA